MRGGDGGVEDEEEEEGGGDNETPPDAAGGTAEGEAFGEGVVEAITQPNFPLKEQNVLLIKHFHHYFLKSATLKISNLQHSRSNI